MAARQQGQKTGKDKGQRKRDTGKSKSKVFSFFHSDKGCNYMSACKMLHTSFPMTVMVDQVQANPVKEEKAAAAANFAAAADFPRA